jgi:AhpD family alkylhydroperoxidase
MSQYQKKTWTLGGCLADHRQVFLNIPRIAGAYVGTNSVAPDLNESVMVTVNSVNSCPFCEGLHGELARMAGVEDPKGLMKAKSEDECRSFVDDPAISFARIFAEQDGRGPAVDQAFQSLSGATRPGYAASVRALCWFLLWGSIGGNTINAFLSRLKGRPKTGSSFVFEFFFFVYYGPLFLIIAIVNGLLRFAPRVPKWFSAFFGLLLTVIAGTWIVLPGLLGLVAGTKPRILAHG